jgi:beta-lactamase superfamily II metal-dependent hydrolase
MAADEFALLRDAVAELDMADLLAIDKAANNTSLVLRISANGKTLLFPGDAESESWALMKQKQLLEPVDLLKLAHHGSVNGMPFEGANDVLDTVVKRGKTIALVSTCRGVYGDTRETEIPHHRLMDRLRQVCKKVYVTQDDAPFGEGFDIVI